MARIIKYEICILWFSQIGRVGRSLTADERSSI